MNITEDRKELFKAISQAQGEFTTVGKDKKNPFFSSLYAPLDSIIEMIRPILLKHGLAAMQFTDIQEGGIVVETVITHESGQHISGRLFMPAVKQDPQGYGSALTYGRRYGLAAALGIVSDEDVDGNGQEGAGKTTKAATSSAQAAGAATTATGTQAIPEMAKANLSLYQELGAYCEGDTEKMNTMLKRITHYEAEGKSYEFGLDRLPKASEKWAGKALTALRKIVASDVKDDIPEFPAP